MEMKTLKKLQGWAVALMIFTVLALGLTLVCLLRPASFGEWLILLYEDLTCELGHTVEGMFNKLAMISLGAAVLFFLVNQILHFVAVGKLRKSKEVKVEQVEKVVNVVVPKKTEKKIKAKLKDQVKKKIEEKVIAQVRQEEAAKAPVAIKVSKDQEMKNILDALRK